MFRPSIKTLTRRTLPFLSFLLAAAFALTWINRGAHSTVSAQAGSNADDNWDARFNLPGIDGEVYAVAASGNDVYVAGRFTTAGGVRVNNIAKWNGSAWSALGNGIGGEPARGVPAYVFTLAVSGSEVYVGGSFTTAGEIAANNIAKWNGTSWSALGAGVGTVAPLANIGAVVIALGLSGNDLYVGGFFNTAGGVNTNGLAKWNGTSWSGFNLPFFNVGLQDQPPTVRAITVSGNDVYIGGYFVGINGVPANSLAKWNGSVWTGLNGLSAPDFNPFFNPVVSAIGVSGADVFVSGDFNQAGTVSSVSGSARWNNGNWSALTGARTLGPRRSPIMAIGTDIYFCEEVTHIGESVTGNLVKWTGSDWATIATGLKGITNLSVSALAAQGTRLLAVGNFNAAGNVAVSKVAQWNGSDWSALGTGLGVNDRVNALVPAGSELLVGGRFTTTGNSQFKRLAKLNGLAWSAVSNDIPFAEVYQVAVRGEEIFVVSQAPQFSSTNLYRWNGSSWSSLSRIVDNIIINGSDLYAITFSNLGKAVSKWDGSNWVDIAQAVAARTLAVNGKDIYVGGDFTSIGGINANRIARWDGTAWSALGSALGNGLSGASLTFVSSIVVQGGVVYAGGRFTTAGGISANNIARWNGSSWSALGSAPGEGVSVVDPFFNDSEVVTALTIRENELFVSGTFTRAGDVPANGIARWNGTTWSALGSGIGGFSINPENASLTRRVNALAISQNYLYAGGTFTTAGSKPSPFLARYSLGNPSPNTPPRLVAANVVARQQGSAGTLATIATVSDAETVAANLSVTATTIPAGLTITEITNTNGTITARIGAPCVVPPGTYTIVLAVTDSGDLSASSHLNINVTANTPPVLGTYAAVSRLVNQNLDHQPSLPPSDNGSLVSVTATAPGVLGPFTVNPTTGVVNHLQLNNAGERIVTVTATDNCQAISTTTFPLTINKLRTEASIGAPITLSGANVAGEEFRFRVGVRELEGIAMAPPSDGYRVFENNVEVDGFSLFPGASRSFVEFRTTALRPGRHTATTRYGGDTDRLPSPLSAPVTFYVNYPLASASAASYSRTEFAAEQIVAAFGTNLATTTQAAQTLPLPTTLAGTTVKISDGNREWLAPLFFVSPGQVNYLIPPGITATRVVVTITNGEFVSAESVSLAATAPGLFAANATGRGLAAAQVLRVLANGTQRYEPIARYDEASRQFIALPIDLSNAAEQVFLILYGTGIRGRSNLANVMTTVGGLACETLYAGAQGSLAGLDQINIRLPRGLAGRGEIDVALTVDGKGANTVKVNAK